MEPLDETMLEYSADADIPMYSGTSASGFWLSQEAAMDDDSNTVTLDSNSNHSETIEVDMEPHDHDEEMTEYEMADGDLAHHSEEIPDVDVIDSSPTLPPALTTAEADVIVSQPMPAELGPQTSPDSFLPAEHAEEATEHFYALHATFSEMHHEAVSSEAEAAAQHTEVFTLSDPPVVYADNEAHPTEFVANSTVIGSEVEPLSSSENAEDVEAAEPTSPEAFLPVPLTHGASEPSSGEAVNAAEFPAGSTGGVAEEAVDVSDPAEPDQKAARGEDELHGSFEESNENPLEISDGVYIDPPPAVQLSLSLGTEESDCYLFNEPTPQSYPQGSTVDQSASSSQVANVLLHDQPTLYYEPLSKVFVALREQDSVRGVPEVAEGELVLDAYDLQLVISEVSQKRFYSPRIYGWLTVLTRTISMRQISQSMS